MTHYIDKDALVTEIEELDNFWHLSKSASGQAFVESLLSFINTLEVKEVDLDESARHYLLHEHISPLNEVLHQVDLKVEMQYHKDIEDAYKAGFELGLKSKKGE